MNMPNINKGGSPVQTNLNNLLMAVVAITLIGAIPVFGATKHQCQQNGSSGTVANSSISVTSENGQTKVLFKGKEVFSGQTTGKVSAQAISNNGQEYAAAFDGDQVIWENTPGAASHLKKKNAESRPAGARQL